MSHFQVELFQQHVLDESCRERVRRHHELFREEVRRRRQASLPPTPAGSEVPATPPSPTAAQRRIPLAHMERFNEVAALIEQFGREHLDAELTGFVMKLWTRICGRKAGDCLWGKPAVWVWKRSRASGCRTDWSSPGAWPRRWVMCQPARELKTCCERRGLEV
jgi:hypothetical protein